MEFAWVALNYLGVEHTTTEPTVRYVGDIHLAYMPYSHSVLTVLGAMFVVWSMGAVVGRARLGAILSFAILSHLLLDLVTHNGDIALGPFDGAPKYGTFLYGRLDRLRFWWNWPTGLCAGGSSAAVRLCLQSFWVSISRISLSSFDRYQAPKTRWRAAL
jgi:hypothetical protein